MDVDGSGAVEWEEFCVLMYKKMREKDPENEIKEAFRQTNLFLLIPILKFDCLEFLMLKGLDLWVRANSFLYNLTLLKVV